MVDELVAACGSAKVSVLPGLSFGVRAGRPKEQCRPRTLTIVAPFFTWREHWKKIVEFAPKPHELGDGEVAQRQWQRYQAYLGAARPVARADFYRRLLERRGIKSIRALAQVTGEDWSRVARVLKLLELPAPVLDYLRTHDSPELVRAFTERRLHELLALREPQAIWREFQRILADAKDSAL